MKKIFKLMMATAIAAFTFTACEDVPEPYNNPYNGHEVEPVEVIDPAGSGTADDPWNVAAIIAACNGLEDGAYLKNGEEVYVTGIVTEINELSTQYGNATYHISDDVKGSNSFYVYRGKMLGGASVASEEDLKDGDIVTVCGKVKNYKGTMEFDQGNYLVSLNGVGGGDTPEPDVKTVGSKDAPKTVAEALAEINKMDDGATSEEFWFVTGKVVKVTTNQANFDQYGNLNYLISADGTENNTITVYSGDGLDGAKFSGIDALKQGDEVIVYGQLQRFVNKNTGAMTPEIAKGNYLVKHTPAGGTTPSGDDKTVGSKDAPKTVAEALAEINKMDDGATSEEFWFVTGKVVKVTTSQTNFEKYGNLNYLISADGTENNTITVYSGDGLNGAKFSGIDALKQGDEVIVYGQLQKYVNKNTGAMTPEIAKGNYLVSLKSGGDTPNPPTPGGGTGTLDKPLSASQAYDIVAAMEAGVTSSEDYYVKGKIVSIKYTFSAQYGTATFNISDDGNASDKEFIAYSCYYFDNQPWVDGNTQVEVGNEVIVCGKVVNYNGNTPEFASKKNWLVSLNGNTGEGGGVTPGGNTEGDVSIDFSTQGYENAQEVAEVTLSDGTKLTFSAGENTNAPKYYTTGTAIRMYPKNFVTVTASKNIASITLTCSANNAEGQVTASAGTVAVEDMKVTISGINSTSTQITNAHTGTGAASQLRVSSVAITYAK